MAGSKKSTDAALTLSFADYRLWWYTTARIRIPAANERLTVDQSNNERLIREGYEYHRKLLREKGQTSS